MHSVRQRCKKKKMSAAAEQEMELTSLVSHSVEEGRARYAASAASASSSAATATSAIRRREAATCATVVLGGAACLASFVVMATVAYLAVDRLGLANFGGDGAGEGVVRPSTSITGDGAAVEVAAAATGAGRDAGGGGATGVFLKSANDEREYRQITLRNGLKCVVVSDPRTDRGSAAMDVRVGSFSDPKELPGERTVCVCVCDVRVGSFSDPTELPGERRQYVSRVQQ